MRAVVRAALATVLVGFAGLAIAVWRISQGPISLPFLVPRLEAALAEDGSARIGDVALAWDAAAHRLALQARHVRLAQPTDGRLVVLPLVVLRLETRSLVLGRIAVTRVEVVAPRLELVRRVSGQLSVGEESTGTTIDLAAIPETLVRLRDITVRDGVLSVVDEVTGGRWKLSSITIGLGRHGEQWYVQVDGRLELDRLGVPIWLQGLYASAESRFELQATAGMMPTSTAMGAWPAGLASEAREWVTERITGGLVDRLYATLAGHLAGERPVVDGGNASLVYEGLEVRFLPAMPPASKVAGTAMFSLDGADFAVARGQVEDISVVPATVRIGWAPGVTAHVAVESAVDGPLGSILAVLDNEPVGLASRVVGLRPRGATGTVKGTLAIDVPLEGARPRGKLGLRATAVVRDAVVPQMPGDWALGAGTFDVVLDDSELRLTGGATLREIPAEITLVERFADPRARRLQVTARLAAEQRRALGIDFEQLAGPVDAVVQLGRSDDGAEVADVEVDLQQATVDVPLLAMRKAAGDPGRASMRLVVPRGVVSRVERFDLVVGAVRVQGTASRPPSGGFWSAVDAQVTWTPGEDAAVGQAVVALKADGERWRGTVTSDTMGAVLAALGAGRVRNGQFAFDGTIALRDEGAWVDGEVTARRFSVTEVSWLLRIISLASLEGLLGGGSKTVEFDELAGTISQRGPILTISNLKATGGAFSVVLAGTHDAAADVLALTGTLIPSYYKLNEGAERLPLVGGVLGQLTGGAIQGVSFVVRGSAASPEVSVRPLSSLAPGALRVMLQRLGL